MKKLFALILALVMMATLSVPAFAYYNVTDNKTASITVTGTYQLASVDPTYSVDITWAGMTFTYTANSKWDPAHQQVVEDETRPGAWSDNTGTITVTNNSNAGVVANLSFVGEGIGDKQVKGQFSNASLELAAAEGAPVIQSATFEITSGRITASGTIGTITVSLSEAPIES